MKEKKKRESYTAPKMEVTSFHTEQGYAVSGGTKIGMGKGTIL